MIIQVISRGAHLRKRDRHIVVSRGNELVQDISPSAVEVIVLSAPCMPSSELISLCMEADISIMQVDWLTAAQANAAIRCCFRVSKLGSWQKKLNPYLALLGSAVKRC